MEILVNMILLFEIFSYKEGTKPLSLKSEIDNMKIERRVVAPAVHLNTIIPSSVSTRNY